MKTNPAKEAADALAALHVMACVASMLEGGTIKGGQDGARYSASRIIRICKAEQNRQFKRYEKALSKTGVSAP